MSAKQPIPMVSVRQMPARVFGLLNEAYEILAAIEKPAYKIDLLKHNLHLELRRAAEIVQDEDRVDEARRRYVEEARS